MRYFDSQRDPVDNSIADSYFFISKNSSVTFSGATTSFNDLTISSNPNFPDSTATRYIINLPGEPYYAGIDAGSATFVVKNINTGTILSRVAPTGNLTANTYKIFPASANTPARIELHVGVGSNQAGDNLSFAGRFINSIISSSNITNLDVGENNYITTPNHSAIFGNNNYIANSGYDFMIAGNGSSGTATGDFLIIGSSNSIGGNDCSIIVGKTNKLDTDISSPQCSGAFGISNYVKGSVSFAFSEGSSITGNYNIVGGSSNVVTGNINLISGADNTIVGDYNLVQGTSNVSTGNNNMIIGDANVIVTTATTGYNFIIGYNASVSGSFCLAMGGTDIIVGGMNSFACGAASRSTGGNSASFGGSYAGASKTFAIAGGNASGINAFSHNGQSSGAQAASFAGGIAGGVNSFAIGTDSKAYGENSFACNRANEAQADYGLAAGFYTSCNSTGTAIFGKYGGSTLAFAIMLAGGTDNSNADVSVIIRTTVFGAPSAGGGIANNWSSTGADYAEYFEWEDSNNNNEDRIGYFVEHGEEEKIKIANGKEEILGIVSNGSGFIGDAAPKRWAKAAKTDKFGRWITKEVIDQFGREEIQSIPSTDWDKNKEYISRADRKEWSVIGLLGKLYVRDNGKCEINKYCKCSSEGIAIPSNSTNEQRWRVINRSATDVIRIFFK